MNNKRTNPDFTNGLPELLILRLLAEQPMHGYQLVGRIRAVTGEVLQFGEGSIYPVLHRLEAERLLLSRREPVGRKTRVVYRLSAKGRRRLNDSAALWRRIAAAVEAALEGGSHADPQVA